MPIDLQTMFSQMNQVGKDQAVQRQVAPEAQALQASELVKETETRLGMKVYMMREDTFQYMHRI